MYPAHIQQLQSARIDAVNAMHDADARCREACELFDDPHGKYAAALSASKAARVALGDAEQALSAALTAWRREGEDEQRA
jgi:hypothetical protein